MDCNIASEKGRRRRRAPVARELIAAEPEMNRCVLIVYSATLLYYYIRIDKSSDDGFRSVSLLGPRELMNRIYSL